MILWYLLIRKEQIESMMTRHVDHKKNNTEGPKICKIETAIFRQKINFD